MWKLCHEELRVAQMGGVELQDAFDIAHNEWFVGLLIKRTIPMYEQGCRRKTGGVDLGSCVCGPLGGFPPPTLYVFECCGALTSLRQKTEGPTIHPQGRENLKTIEQG